MVNIREMPQRISQEWNQVDYRITRWKAGKIVWPEVKIRPPITERKNVSGEVKLLMGGGTIFSQTKRGVRIGKIGVLDPSDFLSTHFPEYRDKINSEEILIYDDLSENITLQKLTEMEIGVAKAMNESPNIDSYIMFVGSDMAETIGRYLHDGLEEELEKNNIKLFLVWANNPIPHLEAFKHCRKALDATREKYPGGVYLVSGSEVIPTASASKETWHYEPMKYFNSDDRKAMEEEIRRRYECERQADILAFAFFSQSFRKLIQSRDQYRFEDPDALVYQLEQQKHKIIFTRYEKGSGKQGKINWLLDHFATDPEYHPSDSTGKVIIKPINLAAEIPTYNEFKDAEIVLFILNHSATTNIKAAEAIRDICRRRIKEGKPLAAFAVTETGEPRTWNPEEGLYPSGKILRNYVVLLPSHIKPTIVKLWAAVHKKNFSPSSQLIHFMINNSNGEILREIYRPDVDRVIQNVFPKTNRLRQLFSRNWT